MREEFLILQCGLPDGKYLFIGLCLGLFIGYMATYLYYRNKFAKLNKGEQK